MSKEMIDQLSELEADVIALERRRKRRYFRRTIILGGLSFTLQTIFLCFGHPAFKQDPVARNLLLAFILEIVFFPLIAYSLSVLIGLFIYLGKIDHEKNMRIALPLLITIYVLAIPYWIYFIAVYVL